MSLTKPNGGGNGKRRKEKGGGEDSRPGVTKEAKETYHGLLKGQYSDEYAQKPGPELAQY